MEDALFFDGVNQNFEIIQKNIASLEIASGTSESIDHGETDIFQDEFHLREGVVSIGA